MQNETVVESRDDKPVVDKLAKKPKTEAPTEKLKKKATSQEKTGLITLGEMCKKNKWSARTARIHLRASKTKKPESGSWAWPSAEAARVEKKLKEAMKEE